VVRSHAQFPKEQLQCMQPIGSMVSTKERAMLRMIFVSMPQLQSDHLVG